MADVKPVGGTPAAKSPAVRAAEDGNAYGTRLGIQQANDPASDNWFGAPRSFKQDDDCHTSNYPTSYENSIYYDSCMEGADDARAAAKADKTLNAPGSSSYKATKKK